MSGASVSLVEGQPEGTQKIIQISGTPEQVERAQSVLQGFILSSKSLYSSLCLSVCVDVQVFVLGLLLNNAWPIFFDSAQDAD